jgi:hypothetical protein
MWLGMIIMLYTGLFNLPFFAILLLLSIMLRIVNIMEYNLGYAVLACIQPYINYVICFSVQASNSNEHI